MAGFRIFTKVLPKRMDHIYMIVFVITMCVSIGIMNSNDALFRDYTSCHGTGYYGFAWFGVSLFLQILLALPTLEDAECYTGSEVGSLSLKAPSDKSQDSTAEIALNLPKSRTSTVVSIPGSLLGIDSTIDLDTLGRGNPKVSTHVHNRSTRPASIQALSLASEKNTWDRLSWVHNGKTWKKRFVICWSSLWMLFYNLVIFMGIHASLLASRIHGTIELNRHGLETCGHLKDFFLTLGSPVLKYPLINEPVFVITYLAFAMHAIIVRKTADASMIRNFVGRHLLADSKLLGILRIVVQLIMFTKVGVLMTLSIMNGYGSPLHVVSAFAMAMLFLWITSALNYLLQLNCVRYQGHDRLALNWLWSLVTAATLWTCGLLFYISVYHVSFRHVYIYIQILSWAPLGLLTWLKGRQIFDAWLE